MIARQKQISFSITSHATGKMMLTQEMVMEEVQNTLIELLKMHSYSELAKKMDVSPNTLHKIASGCRSNLKIDTVLKILQMGNKCLVVVGD